MQDIIQFINHNTMLVALAAILVFLLLVVEFLRARRGTLLVTPAETTQLINHDNAVIIDLRGTELYRKGHIIDAIALTQQEIKDSPKKIERFKNKPIVLVCQTGVESQKTAAQLIKQGYNAYALAGGIRGWQAADMPLIRE